MRINRLTLAVLALGLHSAFSPVRAQELTIRTAVELGFPTVTNTGYRILHSPDLVAWQPTGRQIFGDGSDVSRFFSATRTQRYFQTESFAVRDLNSILEQIRATRNVPALACAVVRSNRIVGLGAAGWRKWNVTNAPVTVADKWHHGSITKSMTATLEQLSSNRGGAPEVVPGAIWSDLWNFGGTPREGRRQLLERMTTNAPASTPGTRYEYSNTGCRRGLASPRLPDTPITPGGTPSQTRHFRPAKATRRRQFPPARTRIIRPRLARPAPFIAR